jgi:hypothetical protein
MRCIFVLGLLLFYGCNYIPIDNFTAIKFDTINGLHDHYVKYEIQSDTSINIIYYTQYEYFMKDDSMMVIPTMIKSNLNRSIHRSIDVFINSYDTINCFTALTAYRIKTGSHNYYIEENPVMLSKFHELIKDIKENKMETLDYLEFRMKNNLPILPLPLFKYEKIPNSLLKMDGSSHRNSRN